MNAGADYRSYLVREYESRNARNSAYSLRAYARDLAIAPSRLTEVFARKGGLSLSAARRISSVLKLDPHEGALFCDLVEAAHARSEASREAAALRVSTRLRGPRERKLASDEFRLMAEWYHLPILELMATRGFELTAANAARALSIPVPRAQAAIDRLARLGWIRREAGGWDAREEYKTLTTMVPSKAHRAFHTQLIRRAERAVESQSSDIRDLHSLVLAFNPERLPRAKAMLDTFCRDFNRAMGAGPGESESLYALTVQFFRVNQ